MEDLSPNRPADAVSSEGKPSPEANELQSPPVVEKPLADAVASAQPPSEAASSEGTSSSEASSSDAGPSEASSSDATDRGEASGTVEGADAGAAAAGAAGEPGDASAKKKRKRKKRKKGPSDPAQAEGKPRKDNSHAPFARFFSNAAQGRRHAFAVGEVVAGRVAGVDHGCIVVDLFGKATAVVDVMEPREIPESPEPHAGEASGDAAPEGAVSEGAVAEAGQAVAEPAEAGIEAATAEPAQVEPEGAEAAPVAASAAEGTPAEAAPAEAAADEESDGDEELPPVLSADVEPPPPPALGSIFRGRIGAVAESGHVIIVNRIIDRDQARQNVEKAAEERRRVQGVVFGFNRGGFDVLIEGVRAFCPASGMSLQDIGDPHEFVGQKLEFSLPASKAGGQDVIVSRRSILEKEQRKRVKHLVRSLEPGQRLKGTVTQVRDFGLFVDVGGIDGLVHQSEISYDRSARPGDVARVGDEVEVQVLRVGGEAQNKRERQRISLSLKALQPDPWQQHAEQLTEGSIQKGRITRLAEFGAFVEVAPQIEGLLHITELGKDLKHASQAAQEGDEISVIIERVDLRARRLSLSRVTPEELEDFEKGKLDLSARGKGARPGTSTRVTVDRVEARGIYVRLTGVAGRRARGFIPSRELGAEGEGDARKRFPVGSELDVKVVAIERDGSLKLSRRAHLQDEERKAVKDYRREAAKKGLGTFGDLLRAKLDMK